MNRLPDTSRFVTLIALTLVVGGTLVAGQSIVFDPDNDPVVSFPGNVDIVGNVSVDGFGVEVVQPSSGDPVMEFVLKEGSAGDWGAFVRYDSIYGGDSNDNRFVLGTMDGGTEYEGITMDRGGSNVNVHRDLGVSGRVDGAPAINWDFEAGPVGVNKRIPGWETSAWYLDHDSSRGTVSGRYAYGEETCCDHDDSGSGGGVNTYDLYKRFSGEFGNELVNVSVWAEVNGDLDGVGLCPSGEAYVGEDDARIILNAYDSSGTLLTTKWGHWGGWHAVRQGFSGDGSNSSRDVHDYVKLWVNWTAPAGTKMLEVDLHAGERTDSCATFTSKGSGNSAVYFDDFLFETDAEGWKDLGGQTQYAQFDTLEVKSHADIEGNLDLNSNTLQNVGGTDCAAGEALMGDGSCMSAGVPSGTVIFHNGTSCPTGWSEMTAAQGRVLVGLPSGGTSEATVGSALSDQQTLTHTHSVNPPSTGSSSDGSHQHLTAIPNSGGTGSSGMSTDAEDNAPWGYGTCTNCGSAERDEVNKVTSGIDEWAWTDSRGSHSHTTDIGSFTSGSGDNTMPYIQLRVCKKD